MTSGPSKPPVRDACPVALLEIWMRLGRISGGPLFRPIARKNGGVSPVRLSDDYVARLAERCATRAGIRGDDAARAGFRRSRPSRRPRRLGAHPGRGPSRASRRFVSADGVYVFRRRAVLRAPSRFARVLRRISASPALRSVSQPRFDTVKKSNGCTLNARTGGDLAKRRLVGSRKWR